MTSSNNDAVILNIFIPDKMENMVKNRKILILIGTYVQTCNTLWMKKTR
jgi:hypothetical protein